MGMSAKLYGKHDGKYISKKGRVTTYTLGNCVPI